MNSYQSAFLTIFKRFLNSCIKYIVGVRDEIEKAVSQETRSFTYLLINNLFNDAVQ
jgi:hypothetical protein